MTDPASRSMLRSLGLGVFLPHSIMAIGQGATMPMIALLAVDMGASVGGAGLIVGLFGVGAFVADLPGGVLASRLGDRRAMTLAAGTMAVASLAIASRPPLLALAVLVTMMGAATALFALGRLAYATELAPIGQRGRVMSAIGGTQRIGLFLGPALGALTIGPLGLNGPFLVHAAMALIACVTVVASPQTQSSRRETGPDRTTLGEIARDHKNVFATAAVAALVIQIVRSSRQAVIPLWGDHIGLDASQIGLLYSFAAGMEMLMFYPVGRLMDRRGRKWAAIPSLILLSLGMAAIPLTTDAFTLGLVVATLGFANGLGSGINMTLSSDLSPDRGRTVFLGVWRMLTDVGTASGPTLVAVVASVFTLGAAAATVAVVGLGGAVLIWRAVPETLRRPDG